MEIIICIYTYVKINFFLIKNKNTQKNGKKAEP